MLYEQFCLIAFESYSFNVCLSKMYICYGSSFYVIVTGIKVGYTFCVHRKHCKKIRNFGQAMLCRAKFTHAQPFNLVVRETKQNCVKQRHIPVSQKRGVLCQIFVFLRLSRNHLTSFTFTFSHLAALCISFFFFTQIKKSRHT